MSLKDNIDMVKEELNSEEKFFEKAVVTEKFVKKYKKPLIGAVAAIVLIVAADIGYNVNKENTVKAANEALAELQQDATNPQKLAKLESLSPELHDLWVYSQAIADQDVKALESLDDSKALLIADLAQYEAAELQNDKESLEKYAKNEDGIYQELALVKLAIIAMDENKIDEAHANLAMIKPTSPLANVAKSLMHYGVK
ncbi:MAG: tetratricopeptide repeat protein [Sulfurimonas sp.]